MASPKYQLHIDAVQTAPPGKVTEPGQARRIATGAAPLGPGLLQSRFQLVLYYNKAGEEESPLVVAAWMKESLSAALPEHPVLSGRLRRDSESGDGGWVVKFNDSGVRLVQATTEVAMVEFLASKDRDAREAKLAYWEDVDKDPNFSALFYIQVTQFQGDGYSIGISCSLLLADPLFLTKFLKSWAQTHTQMIAQGRLTKSPCPMFHLNYFQRPDQLHRLRSTELEPNPINSAVAATTMLFKVDRNPRVQSFDAIALACLQEATRRLEVKPVANLSLIISDHSGDLKVESQANRGTTWSNAAFKVAWWDQFGMEEMSFTKGNKPVHVSCWIASGDEGALVVVMVPFGTENVPELMVSVTVPKNCRI